MFRNRLYLSLVSSHFVIDLFTGISGVLLAVLSTPLGLSNAQIGAAITLYMLANSASQPFFGWFIDRDNMRPLPLVSYSIVWMAFFFSLIAFATQWWMVVVLMLLAALGSGLYHPIGTAYAPVIYRGSSNTATSVFFLVGQMGLAIGPVIGGTLFWWFGSLGILPITALTLLPAAMMWLAVRRGPLPEPARPRSAADSPDWRQIVRRLLSLVVLAFVVLVAVRSSMQAVNQFLLPKLFEDRGWDAVTYGWLAGVFMATAAVGNVAIGKLADRFGMRLVAALSLLASVPLGLLYLTSPLLPVVFVACGLTGLLVGGQHSILVVHAQHLLPLRRGLAAGLILGFTFATGALGTWLSGIVADVVSLQLVMQGIIWLGVPAALLSLTLPGRAEAVPVVSEPAPAARV
jgi:FSR family fosmidomycin resistance protein-like MFS transporter